MITVVAPPLVVAMDNNHLCYGDEITLNVLQSEGSVSWDVNTLIVSPDSTQQYIVTASSPPCPDAKDSVTITVGDSLYIEPSVLPIYKQNANYLQQLISNAELPVFTIINGNFPSGLSLNRQGELSVKNITDESDVTFTVQVEDLHGCKNEKNILLRKICS
jgi:hypothetical protein